VTISKEKGISGNGDNKQLATAASIIIIINNNYHLPKQLKEKDSPSPPLLLLPQTPSTVNDSLEGEK